MIKYIKMKINEWKVRAIIYGAVVALIDNQKDILKLLQNMYESFKNVPAEDLRAEIIAKLAEMINEENTEKNDSMKGR